MPPWKPPVVGARLINLPRLQRTNSSQRFTEKLGTWVGPPKPLQLSQRTPVGTSCDIGGRCDREEAKKLAETSDRFQALHLFQLTSGMCCNADEIRDAQLLQLQSI